MADLSQSTTGKSNDLRALPGALIHRRWCPLSSSDDAPAESCVCDEELSNGSSAQRQ